MLGLAVAGVIIILGVIATVIFLMLRSRSRKRDDKRMQSEFGAMERESQFAAAAEQTGYQKDPDELIRSMSILFRDQLSMPVLGVYAGREGQPSIERVSTEISFPFRHDVRLGKSMRKFLRLCLPP